MADFCKQCSQKIFNLPSDFRNIVAEGQVLIDICEGCGLTVMDHNGVCIADCLEHHDKQWIKVDGEWIKNTAKRSWHLKTEDNAPVIDIEVGEDGIIAAPFLPIMIQVVGDNEDCLRTMDYLCRLREYFGMTHGAHQPEEFVDHHVRQAAEEFNLKLEVY